MLEEAAQAPSASAWLFLSNSLQSALTPRGMAAQSVANIIRDPLVLRLRFSRYYTTSRWHHAEPRT